MVFASYFLTCVEQIEDADKPLEDRCEGLKRIIELVSTMYRPSDYVRAIMAALLDALEANTCDVSIYLDELRHQLKFCPDFKYCIILSEENGIASALRKLYSTSIWFLPFGATCIGDEYEYDYCFICGTDKSFQALETWMSKDRFIDVYRICLADYLGAPLTWDVYRRYLDRIGDCKCVITGMSYTRNALLDELLSVKSCNVANSSQDLYYDFACFRDAYRRNPDIMRVIIGLSPYSLRYDLSLAQNEYESSRMFFYYSWFRDSHNNIKQREQIERYWKEKAEMIELFGEAYPDELYLELVGNRFDASYYKREYDVFSSSEVSPDELNLMKAKYNKPYEKTFTENSQVLKEYVEYATARGIEVVFFIPPFSEWYRERWDIKYLEELREYLSELGDDYDFILIDMSEVFLSDGYFGDFAHLNRLGACYVTSLVNEFLENK